MKKHSIKHIAFIMDGNRRWAKKRGLPTFFGHSKGYENLKKIAEACFDRGIEVATFFAFSTENWNRSKKEVAYLLDLLGRGVTADAETLDKRGVKVRFLGDIDGFPEKLARQMRAVEEKTKNNTKGTLAIAANYGGRAEILSAIKKMIEDGVKPEAIDERLFSNYTWTKDLPDPDLIIRTSGEQRMSGFLTWQGVYSELLFIKKFWPEFTPAELDKALEEYASRQRRFGA